MPQHDLTCSVYFVELCTYTAVFPTMITPREVLTVTVHAIWSPGALTSMEALAIVAY